MNASNPRRPAALVVGITERELINGALREMPYSDYLQTNHWQEIRRMALQAARYRCQVCLSPVSLDVHHISYENLGDEQPSDVVALCRKCHGLQHETLRQVLHAEKERFDAE